jgi:hypothetical protein
MPRRDRTGVFTISPVAGNNMLLHRAAAALAIAGEGEFSENLARYQSQLNASADREIIRQEGVSDIHEVDDAVRGAYNGRFGRRIALQRPVALTLVTLRGIAVNLFDSDWEALMLVSTIPATILENGVPSIPPIVLALATIGLAGIWKRDAPLAFFIAATVAYFVIISSGSEAESRFRVPVMPQIAIAAGVGVEAVRRGVRDMRQAA